MRFGGVSFSAQQLHLGWGGSGMLHQIQECALQCPKDCWVKRVLQASAPQVCTLPGKAPSDRLQEGEIEIGLGIHGAWPCSRCKSVPKRSWMT